ncbi:PAS domain S-box protein [candidate division WOR-3 bacterium]|nr:PAS domain S-box protein [candidate division WOR-3 bacterium]
MKSKDKTKEQPINELKVLHQRIAELEKSEVKLKKAEKGLQEEKNKLQSVVEAMEYGLTIQDKDYNIIYQNKVMKDVFGGLGGKCYKVYEGKDKICQGCPVKMAWKDGKSHTSEIKVVMPNGEISYWENTANPIRDASGNIISCLEIARNITMRMQAEEKLRKSEEKFRAIFNTAKDSIFIKDLSLRYIKVNSAMEKLFGMSSEELLKKTDIDLFGEKASEHVIKSDKRVLEGEVVEEFPKKPVGGVPHTFHTIKVPLRDSNGKITGLCGIARDITKRKRAEEALQKEKEYYRSFVESLPEWAWEMDVNGVHTYSNPAVEDILGYKVNEVVGHHITELWIDDEKTPETLKWLQKTLVAGEGWKNFNGKFKHKNGSIIITESTAIPIFDSDNKLIGYRGIDRDITERKRMEEELRESEEKYKSLIEDVSKTMQIWATDPNGVYTYVSPSTKWVYGYSPEKVIGKTPFDFMPKEEAMKVKKEFAKIAKQTKPFKYLINRAKHKSGKILIMETSGAPVFDENNKFIGYRGTARDVTKRKKAEEELNAHRQHLELINKILRHDLINDLTVIKSSLSLYTNLKKEKYLKKAFSFIGRSVDLISRMRELESFISSDKELEFYNVRDILNSVIQDYPSIDFKVKGICQVMADEALESVLDNIINNAILHGKTEKIDIEIAESRGLCKIRIADYGVGIPEEIKDKIFEESFRFGESGGSGLGLFIVKKTLERYGGSISVEGNKPSGTVFILNLMGTR